MEEEEGMWVVGKDSEFDLPEPSVDVNDPFSLNNPTINSDLDMKSKNKEANGTLNFEGFSQTSSIECKESNGSNKNLVKNA